MPYQLKKVAIFFLLVFLSAARSYAHDASLTFLRIEIQQKTITVLFSVPVKNFETLDATSLNSNPDSFLINYISRNFIVTNNGNIVYPQSANAEVNISINSFTVLIKYTSATAFDSLLFSYNLFFEKFPTHEAITDFMFDKLKSQIIFNKEFKRQLVVLSDLAKFPSSEIKDTIESQRGDSISIKKKINQQQIVAIAQTGLQTETSFTDKIKPDSTSLIVTKGNGQLPNAFGKQNLYNPFINFLKLGVEHILTGYDHILFLIALILVYINFAATFKVITSFTIAHSITLAVSVLGIYFLNPKITEPLIALSIFIIALENIFIFNYQKKNRKLPAVLNPNKRWLITFLFGLIHGFGFSSVLREIGIPKNETAISLLSFNLGVECGQLMILIILLPLILFLKRNPKHVDLFTALSTVVGCCGLIWFFLRVF